MFLESLMLELQDRGGCKSDKVLFSLVVDGKAFHLELEEVGAYDGTTHIILKRKEWYVN